MTEVARLRPGRFLVGVAVVLNGRVDEDTGELGVVRIVGDSYLTFVHPTTDISAPRRATRGTPPRRRAGCRRRQ